MSTLLSVDQKIRAEARRITFRTTGVIAPILICLFIFTEINNEIQQHRFSIKSNERILLQSLSLGDNLFVRQFVKSFSSKPSIHFSGIKKNDSNGWRATSIVLPQDSKQIESIKISLSGVLIPFRSHLGKNRNFVFYYEYKFHFLRLTLPLLLALFVAFLIYQSQLFLLVKVLKTFSDPVAKLAEDISSIEKNYSRNIKFNSYKEKEGFKELNQLATKLKDQISTLNDQNEELRKVEVLEALQSLSRQVKHDIQSPLGALDIAVSSFGANQKKSMDLIRRSVNRIKEISSEIGNEKKFHLSERQRQSVEINSFIEEIVEEKRLEFSKSQVSIFFSGGPRAVLEIEVNGISRAFSNILNNAVEANQEVPLTIKIAIRKHDNIVSIHIEDSGKGVPLEIKDKVFEYGVTSGKKGGTGTGLAQAKDSIVKHSGADIKLQQNPVGAYSTFLVTLPVKN